MEMSSPDKTGGVPHASPVEVSLKFVMLHKRMQSGQQVVWIPSLKIYNNNILTALLSVSGSY